MEYIRKNVDPGYLSFYRDIWKSLDYESVVTFYTGGSDNKIYINDFTKSYTFELNEISLDSVEYVHKRNQKHSGYLMKRLRDFKFYLNSCTEKNNSKSADWIYIPDSNCKIFRSCQKDSTLDGENNDNDIQAERFNTDNITSMPALFYYTNGEFFYTDKFLDSLGISKGRFKNYYSRNS